MHHRRTGAGRARAARRRATSSPACAQARRRSRRSGSGTPRGWPTTMAGEIAEFQRARDGRRSQAAQADPPHRPGRPVRGGHARSTTRASSRIATRWRPMRPRRSATAPASSSARAAATSRTSTTIFRCWPRPNGSLPEFGRELANTVNPMWLLRTLPNNVLGHIGIKYGLKGTNACITSHSVGGSLAVIEAMEALRNGEADRVVAVGHDAPIEPQMVLYYYRLGLIASETLRPFDARARRQRVRRRRRRAGAGDGGVRGRAQARRCWAKCWAAATRSEATGLLAIRDDGDGLARAIAMALDDARIAARRRRHDRRARQRHAAIGRSEAAAIRTRVRRRRCRRSRDSSGRSVT